MIAIRQAGDAQRLAWQVSAARAILAGGGSLREAAERVGLTPAELDVELWRHVGRK